MNTFPKTHNVLIIGAGPAGLGVAIALQEFGVKDVLVVDAKEIGSSFLQWPNETKLLSPSFTGHQFGLLDLNAITYATSPAYTLRTEHPTGEEYANYLRICKETFKVHVRENTKVLSIQKEKEGFVCETSKGSIVAKYIISAVGEFSFRKMGDFVGSGLCRHTSSIESYKELEGDSFVIIGGYESGIDAAIHLSRANKKSIVIDTGSPWEFSDSDPSVTLAPFTLDRLHEELPKGNITLIKNQEVTGVTFHEDIYTVTTKNTTYTSSSQPISALGFDAKNDITSQLFSFTEEGLPEITEKDESTKIPNVFLVGPKVKHGNVIFCFIYKYRERFGVIAGQIATRLGIDTKESVAFYKEKNMYLDDLSCCEDACTC
jgi:thioredoxin reductase